MQNLLKNCIFLKKKFSFPRFSRVFLMINIQEYPRTNKSIESGHVSEVASLTDLWVGYCVRIPRVPSPAIFNEGGMSDLLPYLPGLILIPYQLNTISYMWTCSWIILAKPLHNHDLVSVHFNNFYCTEFCDKPLHNHDIGSVYFNNFATN